MKESLNVEGLRPVDIVNEKEDTEVKSKLLGMSSLIYRANIKDTIVSSFWTSDLWFLGSTYMQLPILVHFQTVRGPFGPESNWTFAQHYFCTTIGNSTRIRNV